MEIERILFPVDLTGSSAKVVPKVDYMVNKFDAELHLVYVLDTLERYSSFHVPHTSLDRMELENVTRAERLLNEFAQTNFSDYARLRITVLRGNPVEQILKYIDSFQIDMVIMSCHGPRVLEKALFGSVAEEVIRICSVPVVCINPAAVEEKRSRYGLAAAVGGRSREVETGIGAGL